MHIPVSHDAVIRFGVFEADLRSGEVRKCGAKIKLQERPFQALKLLLSHPGEIVDRDQLRQSLWPDDVYVDFDRGVISAINRLRDALGDSAENPIFIETVGRRGYRWIAPTQGPELGSPSVRETDLAAQGTQPGSSEPTKAPTLDAPLAPTTPEPIPPAFAIAASAVSPLRWIWLLFIPTLMLSVVGGAYRLGHHASTVGVNGTLIGSGAIGPGATSSHPEGNREAEDFYLKGRFFWNQRTPDSLNKAVDFFTQAIVHDPTYAPAYVGLADCYNLLREYSVMPASEAYPRALAAAKKAAELDDHSSEAHASLAFVAFNGMWDAATADREFRRAIELDPNNGIAHHWYATTLAALGRFPESLAEIERAQALDPASKSILADRGRILWVAGRHEEALALLKQLEAAEPKFISPHRYLRVAYLQSGDYPGYLLEFKQEGLLTGNRSDLALQEAAAKGFASGGGKGLFASLLREQKKLYEAGKFSPFFLAETCAYMGDPQGAQEYLEVTYAKHIGDLADIKSDPAFQGMHGTPAFQRLIAKIGLPPLS